MTRRYSRSNAYHARARCCDKCCTFEVCASWHSPSQQKLPLPLSFHRLLAPTGACFCARDRRCSPASLTAPSRWPTASLRSPPASTPSPQARWPTASSRWPTAPLRSPPSRLPPASSPSPQACFPSLSARSPTAPSHSPSQPATSSASSPSPQGRSRPRHPGLSTQHACGHHTMINNACRLTHIGLTVGDRVVGGGRTTHHRVRNRLPRLCL